MNVIVIKGRMAMAPDVKHTQNGVPVCTFTVAVPQRFSKEGVDFFTCVAWRQVAEFIGKYFTKGQEILLSGAMQSRKYTNKNGETRTVWEIQVDQVDFCGSKQSDGRAPSEALAEDGGGGGPVDDDENDCDDLPF